MILPSIQLGSVFGLGFAFKVQVLCPRVGNALSPGWECSVPGLGMDWGFVAETLDLDRRGLVLDCQRAVRFGRRCLFLEPN